jgi:hypothetical protein
MKRVTCQYVPAAKRKPLKVGACPDCGRDLTADAAGLVHEVGCGLDLHPWPGLHPTRTELPAAATIWAPHDTLRLRGQLTGLEYTEPAPPKPPAPTCGHCGTPRVDGHLEHRPACRVLLRAATMAGKTWIP